MNRFVISLICATAVLILSATLAFADHHEQSSSSDAQAVVSDEHEGPAEHQEDHEGQAHLIHTKPYPHHWISIFLGGATETRRESHSSDSHGETHEEETTHTAGAIGFEYYLAFTRRVGAGVLVEHLGDRIDRNYTVFVPLGYHPGHRWRLVVAPGMEFAENTEEWALRLGANYIIPLGSRWELSPEVDVDFIEGGKITYVYGALLSFML